MSVCDPMVSFADLFGMTLLEVFFLLPLPNCFLGVSLPTFFAGLLEFFLPLSISAVSGAANSSKSAPTRLAAGMINLLKNGIAVLPKTSASASNPRPRYRVESLLVLKQSSWNVF